MNTPSVPVSIMILDKEYTVSCPPDEKDALLASARLLNDRMRQVRDAGKVLGTERMAVMAALNLVHEMSQQHDEHAAYVDRIGRDAHRIAEKIGAAIGRRRIVDGNLTTE